MLGHISEERLSTYAANFAKDSSNRLAMNAVCSNGLSASALQVGAVRQINHTYSIELEQHGISWQKNSGRCWMFSGFNFLRERLIKKLDIDNFLFSGSYLMFYDKMEKANFFLEEVITHPDEPTDGRLMVELLRGVRGDGGEWQMFIALVQKYGIVPADVQPETVSTDDSRSMAPVIIEKLREFGRDLRVMQASGYTEKQLRAEKKRMLEVIYRMYSICYGAPVKRFDFKVRSKNGDYICRRNITPLEFYKEFIDVDLNDYVVLFAGGENGAQLKKIEKMDDGYIMENDMGKIHCVTVSSATLKDLAIRQLSAGEPVYFGCDVGKSSWRQGGLLHEETYDYETLFQIDMSMSRKDRFAYGQARTSHAMTFKGVDLDENGAPLTWRVENSWGPDVGKKGMFMMSDKWFEEHTFEVVINRAHVPQDILNVWDGETSDYLQRGEPIM